MSDEQRRDFFSFLSGVYYALAMMLIGFALKDTNEIAIELCFAMACVGIALVWWKLRKPVTVPGERETA